MRKEFFFVFILMSILLIAASGCIQEGSSVNNKGTESIIDNAITDSANKLIHDYEQKMELAGNTETNIKNAGDKATKQMYIDLKNQYEDILKAGEKTAAYINEYRDTLEPKSSTSMLTVIAENKIRLEAAVKNVEQIINPNPIVLSKNAEQTLQSLSNWVTVVSADIQNQGFEGDVRVIATVQVPNGEKLNQEQTIYMDKNDLKSVSFTFDTKYGDKVYYSVTAEPR